MSSLSYSTIGLIAIVAVFIYLLIFAPIFGGAWTYSLNTWLVYFEKPKIGFFWVGYILGAIPGINTASIPTAVITFIVHLFL
ncbi:MAG: hypothetical protein ACFFDY_00570 [Candidatus Thorarchaeota archaeon]